MRIRVRPPHSKVCEPGEAEVRRLLGHPQKSSGTITQDARQLLEVIRRQGSSAEQPLNLSGLAAIAGISSKRKLQELIGELARAGLARTRKLPERGRPCVVELVDAPSCGGGGSSD
jgi:hypothetical protein